MEGLVRRGLLRARTSAKEWLLFDEEDLSSSPDGYVVSFVHFHERGFATPAHRFLQGCFITTRSSCSTSIPMRSSMWWCSLPCVRDSLGSAPNSIYGGISLPSPSRRRGRRAVGRSCTCRWGALASSSRTIRSVSTRPCGCRRPTRGDTRSGSTSRMTPPPLCRSSPGA